MATKEEKRALNKKWHEANKAHIKEYRDKTKDKRNKRRRELYQQNEQQRIKARKIASQYHKDHPLAKKASTYKISEREIELMLDGGCHICGAGLFDASVKLEIDHNHHTGKVRGVLCHDCNLAIACMKDDPIIVANAITYLLKEF